MAKSGAHNSGFLFITATAIIVLLQELPESSLLMARKTSTSERVEKVEKVKEGFLRMPFFLKSWKLLVIER